MKALFQWTSVVVIGSGPATAATLNLATAHILSNKRSDEDTKVVVLLMNDGLARDTWSDVVSAGDQLHATGAEVFALAVSDLISTAELQQYAVSEDRVYTMDRLTQLVPAIRNVTDQVTYPRDPPPSSYWTGMQRNIGGLRLSLVLRFHFHS